MQSSDYYQNPYDKIRKHSPKSFNEAIDQKTDSIIQIAIAEGPIAIGERLNALDKEWDIDKAIMLFLSGLVFGQLAGAMKTKTRNQLWGPLIQTPFLILHAAFGWSPVTLIFRKFGFRTRFEIQAEREVLLNILDQENFDSNVSVTEWDVFETT